MFLPSYEYTAKRSRYHIMIFYDFGVLLYGRIPTLVFFIHFFYTPTPILPVYVDPRQPDLKEDTTRPRSMVVWETPAVWRRTHLTPD